MAANLDDFLRPEGTVQEKPSHTDRVRPAARPEADARQDAYAVGASDYKAYGVMPGGSPDCDVRSWKALRQDIPEGIMFDYRLLSMVRYSSLDLDDVRQEIDLMFPDTIIRIVGRYLDDLRQRVRRRQVSFIQQYSPMAHRVPLERFGVGEPVIEQVEVFSYSDEKILGSHPIGGRPN